MKAYKFRTVESFDRVADILIHNRLYCSEANTFNDVREGDIRVGSDTRREIAAIDFGERVCDALARRRVCCFCKTFDSHLSWAHYAGGFSGLAIEVDLPDADAVEVRYDDDFVFLSDFLTADDVDGAASAALSRKYSVWKYEQEVRVITTERFYQLTSPITRVITGCRMSPAMVSVLHLVCSHYGIQVDRAIVADWGVYTVGVQPMGLRPEIENETVA